MWVQDVCLYLVLLYFITSKCVAEPQASTHSKDEDSLPTPDMIRKAGYECEIHTVVTADGYILNIHRIPGNRGKKRKSSLIPVFLQHGLLDSSSGWVLNGPEKSLSYTLANMGYDVWLGNARGNTYSREHIDLTTENVQYWDWTFHEMGYYDLPAVLDYILEATGHQQLQYVGHSMGTTMFFVLCTTRPEYNAKIRSMIALAPVVFMEHVTSPIRRLRPYSNSIEKFSELFGYGEFLPRNNLMDEIFTYECKLARFEERICGNYLFHIFGYDPDQLNEDMVPLIVSHNPAGESTKTLVHYAQEYKSKKFRQYDHGTKENRKIYKSKHPPQYDLSLVTAPVALIYADNDLLSKPEDVSRLYKLLKNPVGLFRVTLPTFNHFDFLWSKDVKPLVYDQVIYLLKKFEDQRIRCVHPKKADIKGVVKVKSRSCPRHLGQK